MNLILCKGVLDISTQTPTCSEWVAIESNIIVTPANQEPIDPANLVLAAGTGIAVVLPLVMALYGAKMAKQFLTKS